MFITLFYLQLEKKKNYSAALESRFDEKLPCLPKLKLLRRGICTYLPNNRCTLCGVEDRV